MSEWKECKLGDELELIYGKGLKESDRKKGNIPVFGSNGIVGYHNKYLVKGPGIVIGRKGSVGEIKYSQQDFSPIDTAYYIRLKNDNYIKRMRGFAALARPKVGTGRSCRINMNNFGPRAINMIEKTV